MYFPEDNCPFYRATLFSNYSPNNAPRRYWSLMLEISESPQKPVEAETLVQCCIDGSVAVGLLRPNQRVVKSWCKRVEYAYPTPTKDRDARLGVLLSCLEEHNIFSRGRFGSWKYEVSSMGHSYMQGLEVARRIILGEDETVLASPAD